MKFDEWISGGGCTVRCAAGLGSPDELEGARLSRTSEADEAMLWWFGRNEESLKLETRYDNETAEFVAIVRHPDGREQVKRFAEVDDFRSLLVAFERDLESQRWTGGAPLILPDGWPNKRRTGEE